MQRLYHQYLKTNFCSRIPMSSVFPSQDIIRKKPNQPSKQTDLYFFYLHLQNMKSQLKKYILFASDYKDLLNLSRSWGRVSSLICVANNQWEWSDIICFISLLISTLLVKYFNLINFRAPVCPHYTLQSNSLRFWWFPHQLFTENVCKVSELWFRKF